jgi:hypothetical protein
VTQYSAGIQKNGEDCDRLTGQIGRVEVTQQAGNEFNQSSSHQPSKPQILTSAGIKRGVLPLVDGDNTTNTWGFNSSNMSRRAGAGYQMCL